MEEHRRQVGMEEHAVAGVWAVAAARVVERAASWRRELGCSERGGAGSEVSVWKGQGRQFGSGP